MSAAFCECRVLSQEALAPDIRLLAVEWTDPAHQPQAGQFFMLRSWAASQPPFLSRPISVHSFEGTRLEFLYQIKGEGTRHLAALKEGDTLRLTGPAGNGFDLSLCAGKKVAVVGGGIGTAPLYQVCRQLAAQGNKPHFFAGFRDLPYGLEAFESVCSRVAVATDSGRFGHHGFVTDLFDAADYDMVLTCGPEIMMMNVAKKCEAAGTLCLVSLEKKMACGIGACLGCTCHTHTGPKSVCKNGPVFDSKEVFPHG